MNTHLLIKNDSLKMFWVTYTLNEGRVDHAYNTSFPPQILIKKDMIPIGGTVTFEIIEHGNITGRDIETKIEYEVEYYDDLQSQLTLRTMM